MTCCSHCEGANEVFDRKTADADLARYRRDGPASTTQRLLDALIERGVSGMTLLDIGGGIGAIQHELHAAGVAATTDVDASAAYLTVAREEAERRGYADSATYLRGDFVAMAQGIPAADIVTLDRVICCYPNVTALVSAAASKANRFLAVVYPNDRWWMKLLLPVVNLFVRGTGFRTFIHPTATVERLIASHDLHKIVQHNGLVWQVAVYAKS